MRGNVYLSVITNGYVFVFFVFGRQMETWKLPKTKQRQQLPVHPQTSIFLSHLLLFYFFLLLLLLLLSSSIQLSAEPHTCTLHHND